MELPLSRSAVDFIDWEIPDGIRVVRIRLSGHFSTQSTVVFWVHRGRQRWTAINMNRKNVSSNAVPGHQSGDFDEAVPIWVSGSVLDYDTFRVQCTRLAPGDWIDVQFWVDQTCMLRGVLNGKDSPYEVKPLGPSYVITEEADDVVDLLRD